MRGERRRVHRAPGRHRRAHRRGAPRPRRRLPHHRPARSSCGHPARQGHQLEPARPELPRRGDLALRSRAPTPAPTTTWPTRSSATSREPHSRRLRGLRGRQRPRPGRRRHRGRDRLLRLHLLRGEPGHASRPSRSTTATAASSPVRRDRRRPASYTPLARPLFIYVNNATYADNAAGRGVRRLLRREPRRRSPRSASSSRSATSSTRRPSRPSRASAPDVRQRAPHMSSHATAVRQARPPGRACRAAVDLSGTPRPGEQVIKAVLLSPRCSSIAITFGIIAALIEPVIDFFGRGAPRRLLRLRRGQFARAAAGHGDAHGHRSSPCSSPCRSGSAPRCTSRSTPRGRARKILKPTRRAAGRGPVGRLRLLRADLRHPHAPRRTSSASSVGFTNALAAGLVLGVMIIPTIASLSEDAVSGRPAGPAAGFAARWAPTGCRPRSASSSRPRVSGSRRRRSCSACRARSARR